MSLICQSWVAPAPSAVSGAGMLLEEATCKEWCLTNDVDTSPGHCEAMSLKILPVPSKIYRWNKNENKNQGKGKLAHDHLVNVQNESPQYYRLSLQRLPDLPLNWTDPRGDRHPEPWVE